MYSGSTYLSIDLLKVKTNRDMMKTKIYFSIRYVTFHIYERILLQKNEVGWVNKYLGKKFILQKYFLVDLPLVFFHNLCGFE